MTREELKSLLLNKPNEFWDLVGREGLTEYLISILDEADSECSGEGMEESPLVPHQFELFTIHTREDAHKAVELLHRIYTNPAYRKDREILEQLIERFDATQPQLPSLESHILIKELLVSRSISQREFADRLETSETALSAMLNGRRKISDANLRKISKLLSINIDRLKNDTPLRPIT